MVEFKTKMTESGVFYVPKTIREAFGRNMRILTNTVAVLMFHEDTEYEDVLTSLDILRADVKHRISLRERAQKQGDIQSGIPRARNNSPN